MKKNNYWWSILILAATTTAFADGGRDVGNGGGGEPLFHSLSVEIEKWLVSNLDQGTLKSKLHLDPAQITAENLVSAYQQAVQSTHVKFVPQSKLSDECNQNQDALACQLIKTSRTCMNTTQPAPAITCNENLFNAKPGDEQFAVTFHEHLGIAGIETNDELEYSQYPISKHLMKFANPRTVVRWELSQEETSPGEIKTGCRIAVDGKSSQVSELTKKHLLRKGYVFSDRQTADIVLELKKGEKKTYEYITLLEKQAYGWSIEVRTMYQRSVTPTLHHYQSGFNYRLTDLNDWMNNKEVTRKQELAYARTPADHQRISRDLEERGYGLNTTAYDVALLRAPSCEQYYRNR